MKLWFEIKVGAGKTIDWILCSLLGHVCSWGRCLYCGRRCR